ncbi:oxidative stress defense protein, partial [Klebsiella pneumoniae]|nr:oxidative stress defense protein [Klebsiella pneumoniae]
MTIPIHDFCQEVFVKVKAMVLASMLALG